MNEFRALPGLLATGAFAWAMQIQAATITTGIDADNSAMGNTNQGCIQQLAVGVGDGENCMYDGGPNVYEFPAGSGNFPAVPVGESTGPWSQVEFYASGTAIGDSAFNDPGNFVPTPGDGKIRPAISGTITIDDQGDADPSNDTIDFNLTLTSPVGGKIVRHEGTGWAERYTSMNQVPKNGPRTADSVTPNGIGGFDYVIGTESANGNNGFPRLLLFIDPNANGGACVGDAFGDMECDGSFDINACADPLLWKYYDELLSGPEWKPTDNSVYCFLPEQPAGQPPLPHQGPPGSPGIGTMEGNIGMRTTGSVTGLECKDNGSIVTGATNTACFSGKVPFNPGVNGPNEVPNGQAEDVGWDQLYLKISTNADGNVVSAEGFNVQEYQVFSATIPCGSDDGATIPACNSWLAGHFTIAGVVAMPDAATTPVDTTVAIDVLANDNGFTDPVTVTLPGAGTSANGGTVVVNGSPGNQAAIDISYTPAMGFTGDDTFQYTVDDQTNSSTATVTVTVITGANDDTAATRPGAQVSVPVGLNDIGFVNPVTAQITVNPDKGGTVDAINGTTVGPGGDLSIDFTPAAADGTPTYTETFTYEITDAAMTVATAVVTVTVNNLVPAAIDVPGASAQPGGMAVTDVATLSGVQLGDAPSTITATNGSGGATSVNGTVITYTANPGFSGTDSYDYTITDTDGESDTATVTVTVASAAMPVANPDAAITDEDEPVDIAVTANDQAGSGPLADHTVTITSAPAHGSASVGAGNLVTYSPASGFSGTDSFQYTLTDVDGNDSTTTVTVRVNESLFLPELPSSSALDPWSAVLLTLLPWLSRRRRQRTR